MKTTTLTKTALPFAAVALLAATNASFASTVSEDRHCDDCSAFHADLLFVLDQWVSRKASGTASIGDQSNWLLSCACKDRDSARHSGRTVKRIEILA